MERNPRVLRPFGLLLALFLAAVVGGLLPWLGLFPHQPWLWWLGGGVGGLAVAAPTWLGPVHWGWLKLGAVLGWINSRLLLGFVFFGVVWPIGLMRRWAGGKAIAKGWDRDAPTYRIRSARREPDHFGKPF